MGKADVAARDKTLQTVSINLPAALVERVRTLGFDESFSTSSIVEHALLQFLDSLNDHQLGALLRSLGASLRRPENDPPAVPDIAKTL